MDITERTERNDTVARGVAAVAIVFGVCLVMCIIGVVRIFPGWDDDHLSKKQIFTLVNENEDLLRAVVLEIENSEDPVSLIYKKKKASRAKQDNDKMGVYIITDQSETRWVENKIFSEAMELKGLEEIDVVETILEFDCGGGGIAPSSARYGFYYSENDDMTAIWGSDPDVELIPEGNGWIQQSGDYYYTERITGHFYYYETHS